MKPQRRVVLLLLGIVSPYMCAVLALAFYHASHPGPIPRWIILLLLAAFVATILGGGVLLARSGRKHAASETVDERKLRYERATKGLKRGLVIWTAILLSDIWMLTRQTLPLKYALPGLIVVVLVIVVAWTSLRRVQKTSAGVSGSGASQGSN